MLIGAQLRYLPLSLATTTRNHEAWQAYSKMVDEQLDGICTSHLLCRPPYPHLTNKNLSTSTSTTAFLVREKLRPEDVVATCNSMQDATPGVYLCAEYILAAIDYPTFLQVMADHISISQYALLGQPMTNT